MNLIERLRRLQQYSEAEGDRDGGEVLFRAIQRIAELEFALDCPPTARAAKREDGFIKKIQQLEADKDALLERLEALPAGFDDPYLEDQIKRIVKEARDG